MCQNSSFKLTICISTFNRATFIGATIETIIAQAANDFEILILDGASTDNTEQVVAEYAKQFDRLRYIRQGTNGGICRDYDRAIELARGEYCWLMSDDDHLRAGAIPAVLSALGRGYSLVLVNGDLVDLGIENVLRPNWLGVRSDRVYGSGEMDRLFADVGRSLVSICCIVIKRSIWLARERERYYDSMFVHVGVIFQKNLPGETLVMAEPFICLRQGNQQTWMPKAFEIFMFKWPLLVWSLNISESTKRKVCLKEPWRNFGELLPYRALGGYSSTEYQRLIRPHLRSRREKLRPALVLLLPGALAYFLYKFYYLITGQRAFLPTFTRNRIQLLKSKAYPELHVTTLPGQ